MIVISDDVKKLGIHVVSVVGKNVLVEKNSKIDELKDQVVRDVLANWKFNNTKTDPVFVEYSRIHSLSAGEKGLVYISSPEFLIQYILKNKRFLSINNLVDIYNITSVKHKLAIGCHDTDKLSGALKIDVLNGTERFVPLGMKDQVSIPANAYALSDDLDVLCLFESRQCEKSKVTLESKNIIAYIEANSVISEQSLHDAGEDLLSKFREYCIGEFEIK